MSEESNDKKARVFHVETRFQKMARRTGAIPRDRVLETAGANVDELKPGFDDWVNGELETLSKAIRNAQGGAPLSDWIETANTHSRQLRDVGTTMGSELLTYIANSLCEVLDAVEAGVELNLKTITCHLDALLLSRQPAYRDMKPDQVPELTQGLRQVAGFITTASD